ncbi:hypothetical protein LZF95_20860 [Algoriphagus sp. AGSA1]|uniref:hypothetical protein n=1 Tax=Algoriphagus sp. AGSA1 TaxID=2907213 RepID=UPI001F2A57F6|nr:hypothetical protein [Algoriphagus sp. AGSA1]MCE7057144.1 hypothetical protein [Algoriphagus sp. AGSA1]
MFSYHFFPFLAYSLLVFENDQPTSYFSAHLEQDHAPSPKGEGWGEVEHPSGHKSGNPLNSEADSKMIAEPSALSLRAG